MSDYQPQVGDVVTRSAKGKQWVVDRIVDLNGAPFAWLKPVEGYTSASAPVAQLHLVHRPGKDQP